MGRTSCYSVLTSLLLLVIDHEADVLRDVPLTFLQSCHCHCFSVLFQVLGCGNRYWAEGISTDVFVQGVIRNVKTLIQLRLVRLQFVIKSMTKLWVHHDSRDIHALVWFFCSFLWPLLSSPLHLRLFNRLWWFSGF